MGSVTINKLTKEFNGVQALKDINLDIQEGEFFALLGPSGCGKTTTMRCIAGFETPTTGEILIGERSVKGVPANKRNCGMVFQSYALFPHLNVFENVAYSLTIRELNKTNVVSKLGIYARLLNRKLGKTPKHIEEKVMEILDYVELTPYAYRLTSELSGGQQQRVALARALVMEPAVLLMDEPLSNLDQKLRHVMRNTIRRIQQDLGITTIFVTHDQEEAMSMADRIAVMDHGEVVQIGTPTDLYSNPQSSFIANFVGTSNVIKGKVIKKDQQGSTAEGNGVVLHSISIPKKEEVEMIFRPEHIDVLPIDTVVTDESLNVLTGKVVISTYLGPTIRYDIDLNGETIVADTTYSGGKNILTEGTPVKLTISNERVLLL